MTQVYCQQCNQRKQLGPIETQVTNEVETPWGDIVCPDCRFVIGTITTETPGTYTFTRADLAAPEPTGQQAELAAKRCLQEVERMIGRLVWNRKRQKALAEIILEHFASTPDAIRQARRETLPESRHDAADIEFNRHHHCTTCANWKRCEDCGGPMNPKHDLRGVATVHNNCAAR